MPFPHYALPDRPPLLMPWAIRSFEMTTEVSCSYGKLRGTKLGGLMSGFPPPPLFTLYQSTCEVVSTCATLCFFNLTIFSLTI